jgi:hypothetical protein
MLDADYWGILPSVRENWSKRSHKGGYVYKVTCEDTGRIYIGKTVTPGKRWRQHVKDASNGSTSMFHEEIRRYGSNRFKVDVIASCLHKAWLGDLEYSLIRQHDSDITGYNQVGPTVMNAYAEMLRAIRAIGVIGVINALKSIACGRKQQSSAED